MKIISMCASECKDEGLICSCGNEIKFKEFVNIWDNPVINCGCGKKYLPFYNGFIYPLIYKNKEWEKYDGEILEKVVKKHKK